MKTIKNYVSLNILNVCYYFLNYKILMSEKLNEPIVIHKILQITIIA